MARIEGVDLPRNKRVEIRPYLYLWYWFEDFPGHFGSRPKSTLTLRVKDLAETEVAALREYHHQKLHS